MKKFGFLATLVFAAVMTTGAQSAHAQGGIAIVDLNYIFDNYPKFKAATDLLKGEVEGASQMIQRRQEDIQNQAKQRDELYRRNTPEWDAANEKLTKELADIEADKQIMRRDFERKETKLYYTTYMEIIGEVNAYAASRRLMMVFRFNGETVGENPDPAEVQKFLNRAVLFYDRNIDITPVILDQLNRRYQPQVGGGLQGPRVNRQ
ncbi:MAG: OmpH family outer membrane protein [Pirellulales bacterium]|nr:OmpH family outer membrane protein [Pirellulales bacterium]